MEILGSKTYSTMIALRGSISKQRCKNITEEIIKKIGMHKAHKSKMFNYPFDGKGNGFIYIQPIIESFICWDVWIQPDGAYLTICSCRDFNISKIMEIFEEEELEILNINKNIMSIV